MRAPLLSSPLLILVAALSLSLAGGCVDWGSLGGGDGGEGREGEGDGGEGEGEGDTGEGEGEGGEGEGEGEGGPQWSELVDDLTFRAELASNADDALSTSRGRVFAVGTERVFELDAGGAAFARVAEKSGACDGVQMTGPVAVAGTDLLVGARGAVMRFKAGGVCELLPVDNTSFFTNAIAIGANALVCDGPKLYLYDEQGTFIDDHEFGDGASDCALYEQDGDPDAAFLVRGTEIDTLAAPGTEIIVSPVDTTVFSEFRVMAGATVAGVDHATDADTQYSLHIKTDAADGRLKLDVNDYAYDVAADASGLVAAVGTSALVAVGDASGATIDVKSATGPRFGSLDRIHVAPNGDVWALGDDVILYWTASSIGAAHGPDAMHLGTQINPRQGARAIDGTLFFADASNHLQRAVVEGGEIVVAGVVDIAALTDVVTDSYSTFAFLPGSPPRLVEVGQSNISVVELTDDLEGATSRLSASVYSYFGDFPSTLAVTDDAAKAVFLLSFTFYTCTLDLPEGQAPFFECDSGRSAGVSTGNNITVVDPSPAANDETYVINGSPYPSILDPGEAGRTITTISTNGQGRTLLANDCVVAFGAGQSTWFALDQDQPASPARRRGFDVGDAALVGDRVFVVGGNGFAGQLAVFPAPADSTCADADGAPVLDGYGMLDGEVRSQTHLTSVTWNGGELYVLDQDGQVWHVPVP